MYGSNLQPKCCDRCWRDATAASVSGSRRSHKKEEAPRRASSQIVSQRSLTPSGTPPSGIEGSTGVAQTVAPPPSQDDANQKVKAMVQDIVKSSLTQLGVIPQETLTQSQAQSSNKDPEPLQTEAQAQSQAQAQAQTRPLAPAQPPSPAPAYFPQPQAARG